MLRCRQHADRGPKWKNKIPKRCRKVARRASRTIFPDKPGAESRPKVAPRRSGIRDSGQTRPILTDVGQMLTKVDYGWPDCAKVWPNSPKAVKIRRSSSQIDTSLSTFDEAGKVSPHNFLQPLVWTTLWSSLVSPGGHVSGRMARNSSDTFAWLWPLCPLWPLQHLRQQRRRTRPRLRESLASFPALRRFSLARDRRAQECGGASGPRARGPHARGGPLTAEGERTLDAPLTTERPAERGAPNGGRPPPTEARLRPHSTPQKGAHRGRRRHRLRADRPGPQARPGP